MSPRTDRSLPLSRVVLTLGVLGAATVAMAARLPDAQQPPAATGQATASPAPIDSPPAMPTVIPDSMAAMTAAPVDSPPPPLERVAAPAAGGWAVDPVTGQTLINGQPVVGRVFVMKKTDGIEKYEYGQVYAGEADAPEAAVIGTRHVPLAPRNTRRIRGIMVQATLWGMDHKPTATELRTYRPSVPASSLEQR